MAERRYVKLNVPRLPGNPEVQRALEDMAREVERAFNSQPGPQIVTKEPVSEGTKGKVTLASTTETVLATLPLKSRRPVRIKGEGVWDATSAVACTLRIREGGAAGEVVRKLVATCGASSETPFTISVDLAAPLERYVITAQAASAASGVIKSFRAEAVNQ